MDIDKQIEALEKHIATLKQLKKDREALKLFPIGVSKKTGELFHFTEYFQAESEAFVGTYTLKIKATLLDGVRTADRMPYTKIVTITPNELYEKFVPYTEKTKTLTEK